MERLLMAAAHATSARSIGTGLSLFEGADRVPKCLHGWHLRLSAGEDRSRPERLIIMAARFQTLRGNQTDRLELQQY